MPGCAFTPCPASRARKSSRLLRSGLTRNHNGAVYVIAVNASRAPATTTITIPALVDRTLVSLDGQHKARASDSSFTASFAPLEARIYIAAPAT